jgi:hypothetical protein
MLFPSLSCQENHGWSCWHCSQVVTACDLPFIHPGRTSSGCAWEACPTDPWPKEDEGHGGYKTDRTQRSMMIHDLWDLEFRRFWIFSLAMLSTCRWPQILCEVLCVSVCVSVTWSCHFGCWAKSPCVMTWGWEHMPASMFDTFQAPNAFA